MAVIIESLIRRDEGTTVELGDAVYKFLPSPAHEGRHVALVDNADHMKVLLAITEGYAFVGPAEKAAAKGMASPAALAPAPEPAADPQPAEATAPAGQPPEATQPPEPAPGGDEPLSPEMDRAKLEEIFEREVGRKPNPRHKAETLISQIEAVRAGSTE
jgi:pyruvate/2-oxoglutarate dehydrogenase complex dihydrolipoamide acyltransferase (E2) component